MRGTNDDDRVDVGVVVLAIVGLAALLVSLAWLAVDAAARSLR